MRALVVQAHPSPTSFSAALAAAAQRGVLAAGYELDVLALYDEGFAPAMTTAERRAYESSAPLVDPQVIRHAELVKAARVLVFVYPTWWFGLPAMLKGWLDRVLAPGVAFRFDTETNKVRRELTNVRRLVGVTTYGAPRWYVSGLGDGGRRTIARSVRLVTHPRCRTTWLGLHRLDVSSLAERAAFLERVERRLTRL
ncbi:MAG: NAD(P)H-dependent oxidoreductase [Acidimicrobiales bacterium]